jgi:hypothetical protein
MLGQAAAAAAAIVMLFSSMVPSAQALDDNDYKLTGSTLNIITVEDPP